MPCPPPPPPTHTHRLDIDRCITKEKLALPNVELAAQLALDLTFIQMNSNTCLIDTYPYGQFLRNVRTRKVFRSVISSKTFTVSPSGNSELILPHALRIPNYFTSPLPPTPPHAFRIPVQQPPPHSLNSRYQL